MKTNKKRIILNLFLVLLALAGLAVMSYPFIGNVLNQRYHDSLINDYDNSVETLSQETIDTEFAACNEYNQKLLGNVVLTDPFDPEAMKNTTEEYEERLNITGNGTMGYIQIPEINVKLAIYHGTTTEVLDKGVGHLENTSLPVGGTGTHAVLSAHTAYAKAELFNNLVDLEEDDVFYLTILDQILEYQVDQIKVVKPEDTGDLLINVEEDYVTLVTCTPYGVNSHRLLVRGTRIPYDGGLDEETAKADSKYPYLLYIIVAVILLLFIILIILIVKKRRKKKKKEHSDGGDNSNTTTDIHQV
ncbi:MAG: class C sortase [Lachnospiraceae bacterium]